MLEEEAPPQPGGSALLLPVEDSGAPTGQSVLHDPVPSPPPPAEDDSPKCHLKGCRVCSAALHRCADPKCNRYNRSLAVCKEVLE